MKRLLICTAALVWGSMVAAQDTTTLTSQQVRVLSSELLAAGRPADAANVANLILATQPNDVEALILRTQAALMLGDFPTAATLAKRAYRQTSNGQIKFFTAQLAARAHAEQLQDSRAQLWLRRARQFAPDQDNANAIARDYRALANRNPWSNNLRFGISPSSNVNNGTEAETITLTGLPFAFVPSDDARPLSGIQISGGFSTRYRLNTDETSATFLDFDIQGRTYLLSRDAQEKVPTAKGSDYSDASLGFGILHRRILADGQQPTDFSLRVGQTWYGRDPYTRTVDASIAHNWVIGDRGTFGVRVSAQDRTSLEDDPSVQTYRLAADWTEGYGNGDSFRIGLTYTSAQSDSLDQAYEGLRVSTNYGLAQPYFGMQFSFGLDVEQRDFEGTRYATNGQREDKNVRAHMRIRFTDLEFYGFQPVATVEASRNQSTADLFDRDYVNFGFDLQSSF